MDILEKNECPRRRHHPRRLSREGQGLWTPTHTSYLPLARHCNLVVDQAWFRRVLSVSCIVDRQKTSHKWCCRSLVTGKHTLPLGRCAECFWHFRVRLRFARLLDSCCRSWRRRRRRSRGSVASLWIAVCALMDSAAAGTCSKCGHGVAKNQVLQIPFSVWEEWKKRNKS